MSKRKEIVKKIVKNLEEKNFAIPDINWVPPVLKLTDLPPISLENVICYCEETELTYIYKYGQWIPLSYRETKYWKGDHHEFWSSN